MTSREIADAVVTALNEAVAAETFSQEFTAERHYLPRFRVTKGELDTLKVVVVPGEFNFTRFERTSSQRGDQVTIGILKKLDVSRSATHADQLAEIDPLADLVEEIAAHFAPDDDGNFGFNDGDAEVEEVDGTPYVPDHIEDPHQFTGFIVLTIRQFD